MSATPNQNQANTEEDKKPSADGAHINLKVKGQVCLYIHLYMHPLITCAYVWFDYLCVLFVIDCLIIVIFDF